MIFIVGHFNLDQVLPENVGPNLDLSQDLEYSPHIHWGILVMILLCCHPTVITLFPKSNALYVHIMYLLIF